MPRPNRLQPDHRAALAQYQRRAAVYDLELALFEPVRRRAVDRLALRPGAVVLDLGCGTGLSLPLLQPLVGARGRIVGIEQSPEMIALARERVARHGWKNVELIEASVEAARIGSHADAALFHFTHDILREPRALDNVLRRLRPGARVVASGLQWAPFWAWPVNLFVLGAARYSVSSLAGLGSPWSLLEKHLSGLQLDTTMAGAVFIASGVLRQPHPRTTTPKGDVQGLQVRHTDPKLERQRHIDKIMAARSPKLDVAEQALLDDPGRDGRASAAGRQVVAR